LFPPSHFFDKNNSHPDGHLAPQPYLHLASTSILHIIDGMVCEGKLHPAQYEYMDGPDERKFLSNKPKGRLSELSLLRYSGSD